MHLTVCLAAYSITALKTREWKAVKMLCCHPSYRDSKLSFFRLAPGSFFSVVHCCVVMYLPAEIMLRWYNTQPCFGFSLKADTITRMIMINCVALCSRARNSSKFSNSLKQLGFPCGSPGKESTCSAGDLHLIPGLGRSPGERKATHSGILTWRIPCTG